MASSHPEIHPAHLFIALLGFAEADLARSAALLPRGVSPDALAAEQAALRRRLDVRGWTPSALRRQVRQRMGRGAGAPPDGFRHRTPAARERMEAAGRIARGRSDAEVGAVHLLEALCEKLEGPLGFLAGDALAPTLARLAGAAGPPAPGPAPAAAGAAARPGGMGELLGRLRKTRADLLQRVLGQEHAVEAFVEGLFHAEVLGDVDAERSGPRAVFLFAGPPGVGKTLLARRGAEGLGRAFQRFDMSNYSDHQAHSVLTGFQKSFKDAAPGRLTGFVREHPDAVLLFDEIEKAHLNTLHLFLQVLDAGRLEDKYLEEEVPFRDTTVIFTTNAGHSLYGAAGPGRAPGAAHRRTLLDALATETDPRTGRPAFPGAVCSRLATGTVVLFNPLDVGDLSRIARAELERQAGLFRQKYGIPAAVDETVPLCVVLREGLGVDARTVAARAGTTFRREIRRLWERFEPGRLDRAMGSLAGIRFVTDPPGSLSPEVRRLFEPEGDFRVLLLVNGDLAGLWARHLGGIAWTAACTGEDALRSLAKGGADLVLYDPAPGVGDTGPSPASAPGAGTVTCLRFDHPDPGRAPADAFGEVLREITRRHPSVPVRKLLLPGAGTADDEALDRNGLRADFTDDRSPGWEERRAELERRLAALRLGLWREGRAASLFQERRALAWDTVAEMGPDQRTVLLRLTSLRLEQSLDASDAASVLGDGDRPATRFDDVFGAASAKAELADIVAWFRNAAAPLPGPVRPPRGILLHGPPGTGKTLLARALAGECGASFLVSAASDFVTQWQGSGPQNVRDLFARARRCAPAVVFIDEIDAVGRRRTGSPGGAGVAAEQTLNALLVEMDGFRTGAAGSPPVVILAATNLVDALDPALVRRFSRTVEVDPPDRASRRAFLERRVAGEASSRVGSDTLDRLAALSAGLTISDLDAVVDTAWRLAGRSGGPLTDDLLEEAFHARRMGDRRSVIDPARLLRTARHEAGHALSAWAAGRPPLYASVVARGNAGGVVETEADEEPRSHTLPELETRLRTLLAGRAAEVEAYGERDGLSTGPSSDLREATRLARAMVARYGMHPALGPAVLEDGEASASHGVRDAVREVLERAARAARDLVREHRPAFDALAGALAERNRLVREEILAILGEAPAPPGPEEGPNP